MMGASLGAWPEDKEFLKRLMALEFPKLKNL